MTILTPYMAYVGGLHLFKECHEQLYIMQFSRSLSVEVNIVVFSSIAYQLHLLYKKFNLVYVT